MAEDSLPRGAKPGTIFRDVPVTLHVSVGRAKLPVSDLLAVERDTVLALDRTVNDSVTLHAGNRIVAYGELQELEGAEDGRLAVRITEIVDAGPDD